MKSQMDLWIDEAIEYVYDYYLFDNCQTGKGLKRLDK